MELSLKTLVIIPNLMNKFSFSAPLAWLFSDHINDVTGIYSFQLNKDIIREYTSFIVELNWFIELYEFTLIVSFIKKHQPKGKILFGGLYSQLKYREIFQRYPVDYFIKGDTELPMKLYLNEIDPTDIPNMVGRHFENEQSYIFREEDLKHLRYNIDWFPEYLKLSETVPPPSATIELKYDRLPFYPKFFEKGNEHIPEEYRWRIPSIGGRYHLPMIITARGCCPTRHAGCETCMGSKRDALLDIYRRDAIVLDNQTLISHIKDIASRYGNAYIFINSGFTYDFSGHFFDLDVTIEIDSPVASEQLEKVIFAFRKASVHVPVYREGLAGRNIVDNVNDFRNLEDENHEIYFFSFESDAYIIPKSRRLYAELLLPKWTTWKFYTNYRKAYLKSVQWYLTAGYFNLHPKPVKYVVVIIRQLLFSFVYALNRLKIIDMKKYIMS